MEHVYYPLFYDHDLLPFHDLATAREVVEDAFLGPGIPGDWVPVELGEDRLPALQLQFEEAGETVGICLVAGADGFLYSDVSFGDEEEGAPEELGVTLAALRQAA